MTLLSPLLRTPLFVDPDSLPFVTILVPTFNCSQSLPLTLDSILIQNYPHYEILVIDAGSTDRTLELLQSYGPPIVLTSTPAYEIYRMINQGIALSKGKYLNILFPGDFYINHRTLLQMMNLAASQGEPDLVYCGTLLRDKRTEVKFLFRPLTLSLLKRGQQPTSLQGCWFKKDLFQQIGFFSSEYKLRGGFDVFCRFCIHSQLRYASLCRALVDFDLRWVTSSMVIHHFWETSRILYFYFGNWTVIKWLVRQKDMKRFIKLWLKRLYMAFLVRK